jgi:hypothetical protein
MTRDRKIMRRYAFRPISSFHTKVKGNSNARRHAAKPDQVFPVGHISTCSDSTTPEDDETTRNISTSPLATVHEESSFEFVGDKATNLDDAGNRGKLCELHSYDSRIDAKGETIILRAGSRYVYNDEKEKSPEAALVQTRHVRHGKITSTQLVINSPFIQQALQEVIGSYPGVNLESNTGIRLYGKPMCLFHYRYELAQYAAAANEPSMQQHVTFCLRYMNKALSSEISAFGSIEQCKKSIPRVSYEGLWMAFKPGALVYTKDEDSEYIYKFKEMTNLEDEDDESFWWIEMQKVECNGKDFGLADSDCEIRKFDGFKLLTDLRVFPLVYHKEYERVHHDLLRRGKRYASYRGVHHRKYNGVPLPSEGVPKQLDGQVTRQVLCNLP